MAHRGNFSSRIGFLLAASGAAVGLGNIWKFPFEVAKGGGAVFLLVYLLICFAVCWPVMLAETAIGRASKSNAIGAYTNLGRKSWKGVGVLAVITSLVVLSFYNVVCGWALAYFIEIVQGNFTVGEQFGEIVNDIPRVGFYALLFMFATILIVSKGVSGGIERFSKILMPALIAIIILLIIYTLTLPYAKEGLAFYLLPDFSKLNLQVIYSAIGQACFSLSIGLGTLVTYGSYLDKKTNLVSATSFITLADVGIACLAGLMIFPLVAFMSQGNVEEVSAGPSLLFSTLPVGFASLGSFWGTCIGSVFFLLIAFAALTSTISILEIPVSYAIDELKLSRPIATWFSAILIYILGIPSMISLGDSKTFSNFITYLGDDTTYAFLDFASHFADASMTLCGFLIVLFVTFNWKKRKLFEEIAVGNAAFLQSWVAKYVDFALTYLCPILLGLIFFTGALEKYFGLSIFEMFS